MAHRFRPGPKRERILRVRLTEAESDAIEGLATKLRRTLSDVVREAIVRVLESESAREPVRAPLEAAGP